MDSVNLNTQNMMVAIHTEVMKKAMDTEAQKVLSVLGSTDMQKSGNMQEVAQLVGKGQTLDIKA
ncbi:MAG: hypothetical protein DSY46_07810 [Hydrogenimonas sp.]|nr:MAG: hypothetical protein DSY46_07810 [Hydrogenimonas sp.]